MSVAKFVRTGVAVLGVLLMAQAAHAADPYYSGGGYKDQPIPPPPPGVIPVPFWQGFYAGGHIGGAWANIDGASNVLFVGSGSQILTDRNVSTSGFFGGAQIGYNFQAANFLYGIEADLGGMDIGGNHTFTVANPTRSLIVSGSGGWYGDITTRGGLIYGNALLYAKGGFAFFGGGVTLDDDFDSIHQNSGTFAGWTIGAGIEYMLNPNWTIKVEYLYYDFSNNNFSCCFNSSTGRLDNSLTANTVKLGFNFIFHSQVAPLY